MFWFTGSKRRKRRRTWWTWWDWRSRSICNFVRWWR